MYVSVIDELKYGIEYKVVSIQLNSIVVSVKKLNKFNTSCLSFIVDSSGTHTANCCHNNKLA